jgi:xanthine/CO dehydrogenase XdhC/CoxF family maturation factor
LDSLARKAFEQRRSFSNDFVDEDGQVVRVWAEFCGARPGLFVFGAGDDAVPLVKMARHLGWYVAVGDGRSHLVTKARFPDAHDVYVLAAGDFPALPLRPTDAVVSMTHSLEQDTRVLTHMLPLELGYLGVLGPQRRTADILLDVAERLGDSPGDAKVMADAWLERIHAPMGLDLGGETPRDIALAIMAEIQQSRNRGTALPLSKVRGRAAEVAMRAVSS